MIETPYFDAYMRGERSISNKLKTVSEFDFNPISLIRRSMSNLVAFDDLIGVQPMTTPTGQTFTLRPVTYRIDNPFTIPSGVSFGGYSTITYRRGEGFANQTS